MSFIRKKKFYAGTVFLAISLFSVYFLWPTKELVPIEEVFDNKPWAKPLPYLPPLRGVGEVRAENCGNCHKEIYEEWKTSTHANALSDLQFQSELSKESSPKWLCLNCHTPVANQRETLVNYLQGGDYRSPVEEKNPNFDPKMKAEAVTCAVCHIRLDEQGQSYVLGANGKTNPPHPVKIDPDRLRNRCLDCHNASYTLDDQLVCAFKTGEERKHDGNSFGGEATCGSCHMPEIKRKFVKKELGTPVRTAHKHSFIGGGVPKKFDLYSKQISGGYRSGLEVGKLDWSRKGEALDYSVSIQNKKSAHDIPTGDPERFLLVRAFLTDSESKLLESKELKFGQEWEWWPKARKVSDSRLKPGEKKIWKEKLLDKTLSANRLILEFYHVRLKEANAKYMRKGHDALSDELRKKVEKIEEFYPFSTLVYKEEVDLKTGRSKVFSPEELMKLSSSRKGE